MEQRIAAATPKGGGGDSVQAARRLEVLSRARELLDDPETTPRLTAEEQELRAQVAACLRG